MLDNELVLLCGGDNSRLQSLQGTIYKPFLELHGSTLVARHLERARLEGIRFVRIFIDRHDGLIEKLVEQYRNIFFPLQIDVIAFRGSLGSKLVEAYRTSRDPSLKILVSLGDTFAWFSYEDLYMKTLHDQTDSAIVVAQYRLPFGVVSVSDGLVESFDEKPSSGFLINLGQMCLGMNAIRSLKKGNDLATVLSDLASAGQLSALVGTSDFVTVDSIFDIARGIKSLGP